MHVKSLHTRFYYTSRFEVIGDNQIKDIIEPGQPIYSIDEFDKPVTVGKIYFMGVTDQTDESGGQSTKKAYVLSGPIDHVDTYVEYGSAEYNR